MCLWMAIHPSLKRAKLKVQQAKQTNKQTKKEKKIYELNFLPTRSPPCHLLQFCRGYFSPIITEGASPPSPSTPSSGY